MNPSIKRLLGALLLIGTLGASSVLAIRAQAEVCSADVHGPKIDGTNVCAAYAFSPRVGRPGASNARVYNIGMPAAVTPATYGASH